MRTLIFAIAMAASALAQSAPSEVSARTCNISPVSFEGWQAQQISNAWVRVVVVPQLGGRVMQVSFAGHDFLFVNPKFKGKYIPPAQAGNSWINYGGDKIWPLPEGDQDDHHWVLKSDPLDDGEYTFRVLSESPHCAVLLEGPPDPVTGLQYSRQITLSSDSPSIAFHAVMKNIASHPITWSVQSVTQYDLADHAHPDTFNRNFYAFAPMSSHSSYASGYQVRSGLADDPSFEVKDGLFRLHWLYLENEVWLDSTAGWLAVVDGDSQYAMVEKSPHQPQAEYPGKATLIFYKNGVGLGVDENLMPRLTPTSGEVAPYYMEAELNSPLVSLQPGETYAFDTKWFPTRATASFQDATTVGVVNSHLRLTTNSGGTHLEGTFGVFYPGEIRAIYLAASGSELGHASIAHADPAKLLVLQTAITLPPGTAKISLHVMDAKGGDRGLLDETNVTANATGASA